MQDVIEDLILTSSGDMGLCPPPHVQPQQGVADGLGTPAGHSPGPRRDLQAGAPVCRAGKVILGMGMQSSDPGQSAVGSEGFNSTLPLLLLPCLALAPIRCAQLIDALQRGLRTLFLSFIATVSLGFT